MSEWTPDIGRLQAFEDGEWLSVERQYSGRLLAYVSRRVPDKQAREDVLQETLLGAVRGIANYDALYTFEQYLFGICHNRTIDALRRRKLSTVQLDDDEERSSAVELLAPSHESPSRIVHGRELARRGKQLLGGVLRDWVQETWEQEEFTRLMVVEALFAGSWRNKDTWERFELRDETAVAGVKFRALKRMRQMASDRDPDGALLPGLVRAVDDGETVLEFTVAQTWAEQRVSCPARYWLGRMLVSTLAAGPQGFIEFHLNEMQCPYCLANFEDLAALEGDPEHSALLKRLERSTLTYLRSRTSLEGGSSRLSGSEY